VTDVQLALDGVDLGGSLTVTDGAIGVVAFAHGSGSSRHSPRNRYVASELQRAGLATLLFDLLSADEEATDLRTGHLRFDIGLLAGRLTGAVDWLTDHKETAELPVGLFGASTGAAAALVTAANRDRVRAVVSRGGRPDLAGDALEAVTAPTLLLVGTLDTPVIAMNEQAAQRLRAPHELRLVDRASHLFEEPGTLEIVAEEAAGWFTTYLPAERIR
jgi:dienelactone hydrolase